MTINNFLRKERTFLLFSFLAIFSLLGCQKQPNLRFGDSYLNDNNSANIVRVDTSTIALSTVRVDSISTSGTDYLMVGNVNDPYFGNINSRAFMQVAPSSLPSIKSYDVYDSIGMIMFVKKGNPYYGDSTIQQTFSVSRVDTLYELPPFYNGFWSSYSFPVTPSLGSGSAVIYPNVPYTSQGFGDTLKVRMNDALGRSIFNMIYNNSDSITNTAKFQKWFHGLCIAPGANSQGLICGFKDSAIMRIYYHEPGASVSYKTIDFDITSKSNQFNNIKTNRTNAPLKGLIAPTYAHNPPATPSGNVAGAGYIQDITGLTVKLSFPYLDAIPRRADYLGILRAELTVRPVISSFSTSWPLPPHIGLYLTNLTNTIGAPLSSISGLQTGNLVINWTVPINMVYTYDVTAFVKEWLANPSNAQINDLGLMLSVPPPGRESSFVRAVIADQSYPVNQRTYLSLYYISLNNHN